MIIKFAVGALIYGALSSATALAQQAKIDVNRTGQVVDSAAGKASGGEEAILPQVATTQQRATFGAITLTVLVDESFCANLAQQCFSIAAAGNTNRNPARLAIQVLSDGTPVSGLTDADFTIFNPFVPAGGPVVGKLSCPACFPGFGARGIYTLFVNPLNPDFNWKSGSYFVQVLVKLGTETHLAAAEIEIPF